MAASPRLCCDSCTKPPIRVAVTGAAGQIGYSLLFRVAAGEAFGHDQPIVLNMIELPREQTMALALGIKMELIDCGYPLLKEINVYDNVMEGFVDIDWALLVGATPRTKEATRADLLEINGKIFEEQGKALDAVAKKSVRVIVVGNPANTNCLLCARNAPSIPRENFSAMTRLDHNRMLGHLAEKLQVCTNAIRGVAVFGNHSDSMVPCLDGATVDLGDGKFIPVTEALMVRCKMSEEERAAWIAEYTDRVVHRGAAVSRQRGSSSAASAAKACIDAVRDWHLGTPKGCFSSMAVITDVTGGAYNIPMGVCYSFPMICKDGKWEIQRLPISEHTKPLLEKTLMDLLKERDAAGLPLSPHSPLPGSYYDFKDEL